MPCARETLEDLLDSVDSKSQEELVSGMISVGLWPARPAQCPLCCSALRMDSSNPRWVCSTSGGKRKKIDGCTFSGQPVLHGTVFCGKGSITIYKAAKIHLAYALGCYKTDEIALLSRVVMRTVKKYINANIDAIITDLIGALFLPSID